MTAASIALLLSLPALAQAQTLLAQAKLGQPNDYWRTALSFNVNGVPVRVSGNEDAVKKGNYYLALTPDGQAEPTWAKVGWTGAATFRGILGGSYKIHIGNKLTAMRHNERAELVLAVASDRPDGDDDANVVMRFTAGELEKAIWATGAPLSAPLLGRDFRAGIIQDVTAGKDGKIHPVPGKYSVYVASMRSYGYGHDQTAYLFDKQFSFELDALLKSVVPQDMGPAPGRQGAPLEVTYGFHVRDGVLEITDLTEPPHLAFSLPPVENLAIALP